MSNDKFVKKIINKQPQKNIELNLGLGHETVITLEGNYKKNNKVKLFNCKTI